MDSITKWLSLIPIFAVVAIYAYWQRRCKYLSEYTRQQDIEAGL